MAILHIVNKSAFTSNVAQSCLDHCNHQDSVIFIENGVFNAMTNSPLAETINSLQSSVKFFVLTEDLAARGLPNKILPGIQLIDYKGFVALTIEHSPVQSWY